MDLATLDAKNPAYKADRWSRIAALAEGGDKFAGFLPVFLPQNPVEPDDVYFQRRGQAHYRSYMGSIVNLYTGWLFASAFNVKAADRKTHAPINELPEYYGQFQEKVCNETQLSSFMEERFRGCLKTGKAQWLIELPSNDGSPPENKDEYDRRGLGHATLKPIENNELYDWEEGPDGSLKYAILHTCFETRENWTQPRNLVVETWRIYEQDLVHTFQLQYEQGKRPLDPKFDVPRLGPAVPHGFKRVPVVRMAVKRELCIGEQVFDTQLEHFRLDNALSWLIRRTCYAQPLFNIEDGERPPTMGAGYAIIIGKDDKMGWTSPPVAPFDILQKNINAKRDEIYRIVHQMAQGVDNNAETVGRSADSKEIDAAATRILLDAYGKVVTKPVEETYELISEARGEDHFQWSVEGFAGYDTATVSSLIANSKEARGLGIPSKTFHKELCTKTALALLPEVDERTKDAIRGEIATADFDVSSTPLEATQGDALKAQADLSRAKAEAEPIKANAAMKSASRPQPKPAAPAKQPG